MFDRFRLLYHFAVHILLSQVKVDLDSKITVAYVVFHVIQTSLGIQGGLPYKSDWKFKKVPDCITGVTQ